jgi:HEAT repeat protein
MIDLLQSSNADIRGSVAAALAKLKPLPPEAVTALVDLLADRGTCTLEGQESIPIRFRAAFAIAECAPDRTEIIPVIREALRDRKLVHVRAAAVNAVLGLGAGGRQFVSDLRKQINDSDIRQRARVQYAISLIDPNFRITDEEVRELVETMKHFDEWRRTRLGGKNKGKSHR